MSFTVGLFVIFTVSEILNKRKIDAKKAGLEEFNLDMRPEVAANTVHARPGCVLVAVRDYSRMSHLHNVLEKTNLRRHDIVVMTVRPVSTGAGEYALSDQQLFSDYERELLTSVVTMAEKAGKTVDLLVVPGVDPFDAMVQTASKLQASRLVTGVSARMDSEELARRIGLAWEKLPEPRHPFSLEIILPGPPVGVRESRSAPAAAVARGSGPHAQSLAASAGQVRLQAASPRRGRSRAPPPREGPGSRRRTSRERPRARARPLVDASELPAAISFSSARSTTSSIDFT